MTLQMKIVVIAGAVVAVGAAVYLLCSPGGDDSSQGHLADGRATKTPVVRDGGQSRPKSVQQTAKSHSVVGEAKGSAVAKALEEGDSRRKAHRDAVEAARREREAYRKMSPEEQKRFREKKRAELLERSRTARGGAARRRQGRHGEASPASANAPAKSRLAEEKELRDAAIKARKRYEESMGDEAYSGGNGRRSIGYWMDRVRRERERAAERERRQSSGNGAAAGAEAPALGNEKKETRKE